MAIEYLCNICKNEVKNNDKSVLCDLCNKWNHIECVGIDSAYYEKLQKDTKRWYCPNCSRELQTCQLSKLLPKASVLEALIYLLHDFKILWKIASCYIYTLKFSKWHINDRNYMLKPWNVLRFSDFLLHIHTSKKTLNFCFYYRVKSVPWKNKNNAIKLGQRKRSIVWNSTICGVTNPN